MKDTIMWAVVDRDEDPRYAFYAEGSAKERQELLTDHGVFGPYRVVKVRVSEVVE